MSHFLNPFIKQTKIPPLFWSDLTNQPFETCISCECSLLNDGVDYIIEKAIQGSVTKGASSTIFEYAMCLTCVGQLRSQLSIQSRQNIDRFYAHKVDFESRRAQLTKENSVLEDWLERCLLYNRTLLAGEEYQIYGQCLGDRFIYADMPFMISGAAVDEMVNLISNETMDELNDFMNDLTSSPPELKELFDSEGARILL